MIQVSNACKKELFAKLQKQLTSKGTIISLVSDMIKWHEVQILLFKLSCFFQNDEANVNGLKTYLKARLNCSIAGEIPKYYNEIRK